MNTSYEVPSRSNSNEKLHAGGPPKSGDTREMPRDSILRYVRALSRSKIAQKYRAVLNTTEPKPYLIQDE